MPDFEGRYRVGSARGRSESESESESASASSRTAVAVAAGVGEDAPDHHELAKAARALGGPHTVEGWATLGSLIALAGLLLHLVAAGGSPSGTVCAEQPLWCDPKMVPLRIVDARGEMEIRAEDGATIRWARPGWAGGVWLRVQRLGRGKTRLQLSIEVADEKRLVKEAVLTKGEALEVRPPEGVPPHYFGPQNVPVRFVCDE